MQAGSLLGGVQGALGAAEEFIVAGKGVTGCLSGAEIKVWIDGGLVVHGDLRSPHPPCLCQSCWLCVTKEFVCDMRVPRIPRLEMVHPHVL